MTNPKPVFSDFSVFFLVSALKARKLPDLSGRQIRQSIWQRKKDSNPQSAFGTSCANVPTRSPVLARANARERQICEGSNHKTNAKNAHPRGWAFSWQRKKDSNPHKRSQSPVCYHYTIPLCANDIIQDFWNLSSLFFAFSVSLILWAPKTAGCGKRLVSTSAFHFGTMRFHARPTHIGSVLFRCFGQFFCRMNRSKRVLWRRVNGV